MSHLYRIDPSHELFNLASPSADSLGRQPFHQLHRTVVDHHLGESDPVYQIIPQIVFFRPHPRQPHSSAMVSSNFVIVLIASAAPSVLGLASFTSKIPNGDSIGKSLGHAGSDYTAFGTLFSKSGKSWAAVCKQAWPDSASVTVGAVLGDPCCKWTSGQPDFPLSAPNLSGTVCAAAAAPAPAPAAAQPAAATPLMTPAAVPAVLPAAAAGKAAPGGKGEVLCEAA